MVKLSAEEITSRKAWRSMLVPAVGSAAFFASMVVNVMKTHKEHGWPKRAFRKNRLCSYDYSIPHRSPRNYRRSS